MPAVVDVAPALNEKIMAQLKASLSADRRILAQCDILARGEATYHNAHIVSQITGEHTARALQTVLRPSVLPDGRMYYNIADRTLRPAVTFSERFTADYAEQMQAAMNRRAGTNMKAIRPRESTSVIDNLCGMISEYENFADGAWILNAPVKNVVENVVDKFVRANAAFAEASGMGAVVVRTAEADCCPWCADLEGTYDYKDVKARGSDVYRRHNNCQCITEYYPGEGGKVNNVWNHSSWREM